MADAVTFLACLLVAYVVIACYVTIRVLRQAWQDDDPFEDES